MATSEKTSCDIERSCSKHCTTSAVLTSRSHPTVMTPPPPPPPPRIRLEEDEEKKELVLIFHDESIFNTNEGQTWMWGESERPAILPKTKGSGIMVSDFVEEYGGYLKLSPEELDVKVPQH